MTRSDQPAVDDIVTRLRNATPYGLEDPRVLADAAAEIERLNNIITELKAHIQWLTQTAQDRIHGGPQ